MTRIAVVSICLVAALVLYGKYTKPSAVAAPAYCITYGPAEARSYHWTSADFFAGTKVLSLCEAIDRGDATAVERLMDGP